MRKKTNWNRSRKDRRKHTGRRDKGRGGRALERKKGRTETLEDKKFEEKTNWKRKGRKDRRKRTGRGDKRREGKALEKKNVTIKVAKKCILYIKRRLQTKKVSKNVVRSFWL